ncbi:MAG: type II secretion system protein GspL [Dokdonella sp.]
MSDRLLLRLAPDGGLTWLRQSGGIAPGASAAGLPPASVLAASGEVVVLVPAEDVLLTQTRLTARNRVQLLQALPYAVEDQLLSPVEELHFAAAQDGGESIGVAVVAKSRLRGWLQQMDEAGLQPDSVVPESLALAPGTVIVEEARAIARLGDGSAFACAPGDLANWLAHAGIDESLSVYDFRVAPTAAPGVTGARHHERQRDPLAFLAASRASRPGTAINLLDGEFASQHRGARGARWWRIAAAFAAAVLLLAVADLGVGVLQLARTSARIDTLSQEAVRKAFPDVDAAQLARLSPEQLMRGRLDRLRGGAESSGLLRVLAQIAPVLGSTTRIQTRGMEYRNGVFELSLRAPDVAALDSVRERFATVPGLKVEVTAANPGADGVDGRIRIGSADARGGAP